MDIGDFAITRSTSCYSAAVPAKAYTAITQSAESRCLNAAGSRRHTFLKGASTEEPLSPVLKAWTTSPPPVNRPDIAVRKQELAPTGTMGSGASSSP